MSYHPTDDPLYSGDNLDVLRCHVDDESVDLLYLDQPFAMKQPPTNYEVRDSPLWSASRIQRCL
jgi:hypothetical protein